MVDFDLDAFQELFEADGNQAPEYVNFPIGEVTGMSSMVQHIWNYREATRAISAAMDSGQTELVFPWITMARHVVELALKDVIQEALRLNLATWNQLTDQASPGMHSGKLWKTHDLRLLAGLVGAIVQIHASSIDMKTWVKIAAFLGRWQDADPQGAIFRYARTQDGKAITTKPPGEKGETQPDGMIVLPAHNITHKLIESRYEEAIAFLVDGMLTGWFDEVESNLANAHAESE